MGTPVRAIGDGVIVREGWGNGYGNMLEIRHRNGYVTRYGHLSRFSYERPCRQPRHHRPGRSRSWAARGLATGPHLHFEVLVNGQQRDPRVALKQTGGDPIPASERATFSQMRDRLLASIGDAAHGRHEARRSTSLCHPERSEGSAVVTRELQILRSLRSLGMTG